MRFTNVFDLPCGASMSLTIEAEFGAHGQEMIMVHNHGSPDEPTEEFALKQYDRWKVVVWHAHGTAIEVAGVTKKHVQDYLEELYLKVRDERERLDKEWVDMHNEQCDHYCDEKRGILVGKAREYQLAVKELDCLRSFYRAVEKYQHDKDSFEIVKPRKD